MCVCVCVCVCREKVLDRRAAPVMSAGRGKPVNIIAPSV